MAKAREHNIYNFLEKLTSSGIILWVIFNLQNNYSPSAPFLRLFYYLKENKGRGRGKMKEIIFGLKMEYK